MWGVLILKSLHSFFCAFEHAFMFQKIRDYIVTHSFVQEMESRLRRTRLSSADISLYYFLLAFVRNLKDNDIYIKASGVAFHFTMAIFPTIIFVFTLIPYIPVDNLEHWIFSMLNNIIPAAYVDAADTTIRDLVGTRRSGLMSFGFITAFYLATNGVKGLMNAFNSCYHLHDNRNLITQQLVAVFLTVVLAVIFIVSIFLLILENLVVSELHALHVIEKEEFISYLITFLTYLIVVVMFFSGISMIFVLAPGVPRRWGFFSRGSVIAGVLSVIVTKLFSFYIDSFGSYNKLYGSLGIFIALMAWQLAISVILLICFEINATFDELKHKKERLYDEEIAKKNKLLLLKKNSTPPKKN